MRLVHRAVLRWFPPNTPLRRLPRARVPICECNVSVTRGIRTSHAQTKKPTHFGSAFRVPRTGFEPARLAALPPQSSASANSATWAFGVISRHYMPLFFAVEGAYAVPDRSAFLLLQLARRMPN